MKGKGARGQCLKCDPGSALHMEQHRNACAQEEDEPDLLVLPVQTQKGNANVMAVCHPGISGSLAGCFAHMQKAHADVNMPTRRSLVPGL